MNRNLLEIKEKNTSWRLFIQDQKNKKEFAWTLSFLIAILLCLTRFLNFVENRTGVALPDPLLRLFQPVDLTWITFSLIYISLLVALFILIKNPAHLLFAIQLYTIMVAIRMVMMYTLPLEPPQHMIALKDPFVELFGEGKTLTKDLFFSGHTATLFLLFLVTENTKMKPVFLVSTIAVAFCVLLQHVHYTIDVITAPVFTYFAFILLTLAKKNKISNN